VFTVSRRESVGADGLMRLLVTGGVGFIGSNFVRYMFTTHEDLNIVNLDRLSYGSNLANPKDLEDRRSYSFLKGDINDSALVSKAAGDVEAIVNFAAETHVDRSISEPRSFHESNTAGVLNQCTPTNHRQPHRPRHRDNARRREHAEGLQVRPR
jgi:dTDP-D-glucose 4,6-dehydratase